MDRSANNARSERLLAGDVRGTVPRCGSVGSAVQKALLELLRCSIHVSDRLSFFIYILVEARFTGSIRLTGNLQRAILLLAVCL